MYFIDGIGETILVFPNLTIIAEVHCGVWIVGFLANAMQTELLHPVSHSCGHAVYAQCIGKRIICLSPKETSDAILIHLIIHFIPVCYVREPRYGIDRDKILEGRVYQLVLAVMWLPASG